MFNFIVQYQRKDTLTGLWTAVLQSSTKDEWKAKELAKVRAAQCPDYRYRVLRRKMVDDGIVYQVESQGVVEVVPEEVMV